MLSIILEQYDYKALTKSYMDIFNSKKFAQFLNTTQTGYAHSSSGIEFSVFMKTIFTSLCFCTIQLTLFCLLRSVFNYLYQPRCFCVPIAERMEVLPRGFFKWIVPTLKCSINTYLSLGLDAYFFVRFISVLLLFFLFVGTLNMIILIPINFTGSSTEYSAFGLDKLSLSNIANTNVRRLNAHFIMGLVTIGFFHWLIVYEFQSYVTIRQSYLLSPSHKESVMAKTLLISNVPPYLQDHEVLRKIFEVVPGGIKDIWDISDFEKIDHEVKKAHAALYFLERSQILGLKKFYHHKNSCWCRAPIGNSVEEARDFLVKHDVYFYPPIYFGPVKIPEIERTLRLMFPGWLRVFALQRRVSMANWSLQTLYECHNAIEEEKLKLASGQLAKHNKIFIEFATLEGAYIAHQCLLSQAQGHLDKTLIEVNPDDIIWRNVGRNDGIVCKFEKYLVTIIFISIIILYVIPVSLIGLVSQIPLLTQLMPFLKWVYHILTEIVMITFRFLTYFKGRTTGHEVEMDLQKWYFAFLFVQQFLVVTILSSVTVILKQIIDQPTSIPILLATNLPNTVYKHIDSTPRQKFNRITNLPKIKWGTTFAVYSIYACIGLSYSIISPLISIFIIFFLNLSILYYKYALKYVYSHINESETMEGSTPLHCFTFTPGYTALRWIMTGVLILTIFANTTIYNRYLPHFSNLPILSDKAYKDGVKPLTPTDDPDSGNTYYLNHKLLYLNPAFKYESPKVWLPRDPFGYSEIQLQELQNKSQFQGQTNGAQVQFGKVLNSLKLIISEAPPDYK
ncbi:putative membrane protein C24H6.13 [Candida viswanathii]|uniref:Putative membrane protein C24H6.13 n=1 Tax=Candida viswanathii TaxID=5486 RepID=A0A367Y1C9_9ASCO|nr:putative membrane protein C24H6.13 [Candida viswanathii]